MIGLLPACLTVLGMGLSLEGSGRSSAWQSTGFGSQGSQVQILPPRPFLMGRCKFPGGGRNFVFDGFRMVLSQLLQSLIKAIMLKERELFFKNHPENSANGFYHCNLYLSFGNLDLKQTQSLLGPKGRGALFAELCQVVKEEYAHPHCAAGGLVRDPEPRLKEIVKAGHEAVEASVVAIALAIIAVNVHILPAQGELPGKTVKEVGIIHLLL